MDAEALLFDLDGTLTDTFELWYSAVAEMVRRHCGWELDREEYRRRWWGMDGRGKLVELLPQARQRVEDFYGELVELLLARTELVRPLPGRREALEAWSAVLPLAVISNGPMPFLEAQLRQVGFDGFFAVRIADAAPKPSPEGILRACNELGVAPARAVFVGDSRFDEEAARAAGTGLVLVRETERLDEALQAVLGGPAVRRHRRTDSKGAAQ
ncbi:MAG: HAD family hydrolase [Armatimonadetes bacterium]|nr:HAD family hydrolase [Armatimonadota bacterium]